MSGSHILILAVVVIIFILGPAKLPQLGRGLGDAIRGFKRGMAGEEEGEIDVTDSAKENLKAGESAESAKRKQAHKDKV